MVSESNGNCYLCGAELNQPDMQRHLMNDHHEESGTQEYCLIKAGGLYNKDMWLYVQFPVQSTLASVDEFLRRIWLECCGHMSAFYGAHSYASEISKSRKLHGFSAKDKLRHDYDFGQTTKTMVTFVGTIRGNQQLHAPRLLARNIPPRHSCVECGASAVYIYAENVYEVDSTYYCADCARKFRHRELLLPVTNSPRMGMCGYTGHQDHFAFDPAKIKGRA